MSGEEKNKLDELFKSGLDIPDTHFEYNSGDWDNMVQLMDAQTKRRGITYLWPMLSGIAAALLIFLGWWFFKPATVSPAEVVAVKPVPAKQAQTPANQIAGVATDRPETAATHPNNQAADHSIAKVDKNNLASGAVGHTPHQTGRSNNVNTYAGNRSPHAGKNAPFAAQHQNDAMANSSNSAQQIAVVPNSQPSKQQVDIAPTTNPAQVNASATAIAAITNPATTPAVKADMPDNSINAVPAIADNNKKVKATVTGSHGPQLGLAIMVSPDVNGVSSFQNAKLGTNIGLMFSVGLTKKLTISTGAAYSKKPYLTSFANYTTAYKFKTDPQDVYADCRVVDIPLNVDYKLYSRSKNSFSIGSGLSSYIMLNEKYTYDYADPATVGPTEYVVTNKNRHFFGVMNVNATFEHEISPKISIAAQPYLKVPLTDIGYSKVRLQSAGLALGVRWKLHR